MKRLLILLAATALSAPALAQHSGHHPPGHTMPMPKAKPKAAPKPAPRKAVAKARPAPRPAAKPKPKAAAKPAARKAAPKPAPKQPVRAADPHAAHQMPAAPAAKSAADPHAGHQMPQAADPHAGHQMPQAADPHAGHQMPAAPARQDAHAGHQMGTQAEAPAPPLAPAPPGAFSGPDHAADLIYGNGRMAEARAELRKEHGSLQTYKLLIDQLETKIRNGRDGYAWDGQAWYGGDIDKAWFKTEGEGAFGEAVDEAEVQALWSHAIDPWFDLQAGVRYDFRPHPERAYLVLGVQGLAPYWFEIDGAAFVSNKGDVSARFEGEYDLRLTRRLILQPRVELDFALRDVPELGVGSGLSTAEAGFRLRYEFMPTFAPYIGVQYERAFGDTRRFRAGGEDAGGLSLLLGVRAWF